MVTVETFVSTVEELFACEDKLSQTNDKAVELNSIAIRIAEQLEKLAERDLGLRRRISELRQSAGIAVPESETCMRPSPQPMTSPRNRYKPLPGTTGFAEWLDRYTVFTAGAGAALARSNSAIRTSRGLLREVRRLLESE